MNIADSGNGFTAEALAQVASSLRRKKDLYEKRDGLGLFICKHLVAINGGSLSVFSAGSEKGSTFSFKMQMTRPERSGMRSTRSS